MSHPRMSSDEIRRLRQEIYDQQIRTQVETEGNVGKLISMDVETGDFEIGDDTSLAAPRRLHERHPGAAVYTVRVGYEAAYGLGGALERTIR